MEASDQLTGGDQLVATRKGLTFVAAVVDNDQVELLVSASSGRGRRPQSRLSCPECSL